MEGYYFANISFAGDDRAEFQSGDVIGYHQQRLRPCYRVWNIESEGYTSYQVNNATINIEDNSFTNVRAIHNSQPLIQVVFGMTHS